MMLIKPTMNLRGWRIRLMIVALFWVFSLDSAAEWQSPHYQDHPLVGKIWDIQASEWIDEALLVQRLSKTKMVLLGEVHTNPDHHILQARYIQRLQVLGKQTAVVMEMLPLHDWKYQPRYWYETEPLLTAAKSSASNWPWDLYRPILDVIVNDRVALFAAGLSRVEVKAISKQKLDKLSRGSAHLLIASSVDDVQRRALTRDVVDAHCGYMQENQAGPLVDVQIARDLSFAWTMNDVSRFARVILIAGSGHVGKHNAVPAHLAAMGVDSQSLTFFPVYPDQEGIEDYLPALLERGFDYVFFTPSTINQSPCEVFRDQLEKLMHSKDA